MGSIKRFIGWDEYPPRVKVLVVIMMIVTTVFAVLIPFRFTYKPTIMNVILLLYALMLKGFVQWRRDVTDEEDEDE